MKQIIADYIVAILPSITAIISILGVAIKLCASFKNAKNELESGLNEEIKDVSEKLNANTDLYKEINDRITAIMQENIKLKAKLTELLVELKKVDEGDE